MTSFVAGCGAPSSSHRTPSQPLGALDGLARALRGQAGPHTHTTSGSRFTAGQKRKADARITKESKIYQLFICICGFNLFAGIVIILFLVSNVLLILYFALLSFIFHN